jgi:acyl-CoA thioester hydrolase
MRMTFDPPTDTERYHFAHRLRVRFSETDAMSVVHHSAYLPYLEEARVEYLRALGHPYDDVRLEGIDFTVVELAVRYLRPLRFGEQVDIHVALAWTKGATFQMDYLLEVDGESRATAVSVHGVVDRAGRAMRTPAWLLALLSTP